MRACFTFALSCLPLRARRGLSLSACVPVPTPMATIPGNFYKRRQGVLAAHRGLLKFLCSPVPSAASVTVTSRLLPAQY
jgi:hypothetical protein